MIQLSIAKFRTLQLILVCVLLFSACEKSEQVIAIKEQKPFSPPALDEMVIYEINPNAFSSSKDIQGIQARLDTLKNMGINTIWIMPIYSVGILKSHGSPYCVKNYKEINSSYGTIDEFSFFVQEAHKRNIAVLLDWVANHTSWDNEWMEHPEWYTHDENNNIIQPVGTYWWDVADLNYDNAEMRLAMIEAMSFWVKTTDIDGFRCDKADYIPYDFWKQANDSLKKIPNKQLVMLAEGEREDHFGAGFQLNYSWTFLSTLKNVFAGTQTVNELYAASSSEYAFIPPNSRKLRFTTNNDETATRPPVIVFGGKEGATAASVLSTFMNGVPLFYCGQEVGVNHYDMYNFTNYINWQMNPTMRRNYINMITFYRRSEAARKGVLMTFPHTVIAGFSKSFGTDKIAVIVNTQASQQEYDVPPEIEGNWKNTMNNDAPITLNNTLTVGAYQYYILQK